MTSKLGGRRTKDSPISDAFNQLKVGASLSKKEILKAKRIAREQLLRQDEVNRKRKEELDKLKEKVEQATSEIGRLPKPPDEKLDEKANDAADTASPDSNEDEKSAYQMLQHLRYAYRNAKNDLGLKGRSRLMALMSTDSEFKYFVKELMKIEAMLLAAKLRKGEDEGGNRIGSQNFFVVLKGLEDDKKFLTVGTEDKTVDMKQIEHAINPAADHSYEVEEVANQRDAPEQLQKSNNPEEW